MNNIKKLNYVDLVQPALGHFIERHLIDRTFHRQDISQIDISQIYISQIGNFKERHFIERHFQKDILQKDISEKGHFTVGPLNHIFSFESVQTSEKQLSYAHVESYLYFPRKRGKLKKKMEVRDKSWNKQYVHKFIVLK